MVAFFPLHFKAVLELQVRLQQGSCVHASSHSRHGGSRVLLVEVEKVPSVLQPHAAESVCSVAVEQNGRVHNAVASVDLHEVIAHDRSCGACDRSRRCT